MFRIITEGNGKDRIMGFENVKKLSAYETVLEKELKDLKSEGLILRHKKTGARLCLISNDDDNKVFYIGFKTPPKDSTGVQHIMEHSVLCGSEKYPPKDPFVELAKGSLNTFLNAMTYPDKTVYPVASCNDKDFKNLMDVYLDAVFHPNICKKPQIFKQEGWHYELDDKDGDIKINGVVYNEMKGAFSSPDDMLDREIVNSLFPDNEYSNESGGDPDKIPDLTYEDFMDFHKQYYHPSNSYVYLYGNMDMAERLDYIDREYLSKYEAIDIDTDIRMQEPFKAPVKIVRNYSITNDEPEEKKTFLSFNTVVDTSLNRELYVAFSIIEYTLLIAPGAVLKQALLDEGIGEDIDSNYENGILQPYFSVIARNADENRLEDFKSVIKRVLEDVTVNGLDKKALRGGLSVFEFRYREADYGSYPKGLIYGLKALDSWLYDEKAPFIHIEANDTFAFLRDNVDTGYFEDLIRKYLLDNSHCSIVILKPERGLTAKKDNELARKLKEYKNSLTEEGILGLIEDTEALHRYQEEPSTQEELLSIPLLEISDIKKEAEPFCFEENKVDETTVLTHDIYTNGIGYLTLGFDLKKVPTRLVPYMGLYKNIFGYMSTENFSYADLTSEINQNSGGISSSYQFYTKADDPDSYRIMYEIKAKVLYDKLPFAFDIISEIINTSKVDDEKRLHEILNMIKSRLQNKIISAGHAGAIMRAISSCSEQAALTETATGIEYYRFIDNILSDFDANKEQLISDLKGFADIVFRPENLFVDFTGEAFMNEKVMELTRDLKKKLITVPVKNKPYSLKRKAVKEGFKTGAKVQYVATAGNYIKNGFKYTGSLRVLSLLLSYDYLWINVRVKGGAYGCMNLFGRTGDSYIVSYRDPNLRNTLEIYKGIAGYIRNFDPDERDMTKNIIGTISEMDFPLTPRAKGSRSMSAYLCGETYERIQKERDEVLATTAEDIRNLADLVDSVVKEEKICVFGGEETIEKEASLFDKTESVF